MKIALGLALELVATRAGALASVDAFPLEDGRRKVRGTSVGVPAGLVRSWPDDEIFADVRLASDAVTPALRYGDLDAELARIKEGGPGLASGNQVAKREAAHQLPFSAARDRYLVLTGERFKCSAKDLFETHD